MNEKTNFTLIISEIIEYLGVSRNDFAKTLGYSRSQSIYDIASGKSRPSFDFFERFFKSEYKNIFNPNWMFTGEGDMLKEAYLTEEDVIYHVREDETSFCKGVALVDRSNVNILFKNIRKQKLSEALPLFEFPFGQDYKTIMFEVINDSLLPKFEKGDFLICKEAAVSNEELEDGIWVLAYDNDIIFGRLSSSEGDSYVFISNASNKTPFKIEIDKIKRSWIVKMSLTNI